MEEEGWRVEGGNDSCTPLTDDGCRRLCPSVPVPCTVPRIRRHKRRKLWCGRHVLLARPLGLGGRSVKNVGLGSTSQWTTLASRPQREVPGGPLYLQRRFPTSVSVSLKALAQDRELSQLHGLQHGTALGNVWQATPRNGLEQACFLQEPSPGANQGCCWLSLEREKFPGKC